MKRRQSRLLIGRNSVTGERVFLDSRRLLDHAFLPGSTGSGKTTTMELMLRQHIRNGDGVCLLDPEGTIYNEIIHYIVQRKIDPGRVVLIDPHDEPYRFGINYFELANETVSTKVDKIIRALQKVLGKTEDQGVQVEVEDWGAAGLQPLMHYPHTPLSLAELGDLVRKTEFRDAVLTFLPDTPETRFAKEEWGYFNEELRKQDRHAVLRGIHNRAAFFDKEPLLREMVGQANTIDWRQAMDDGKIVLCNLWPSPPLNKRTSSMLGIMILNQIVSGGRLRPEGSRPFYVYVDELSQFIADPDDLIEAMQLLRKRGVGFVLGQQTLAQLKDGVADKLYNVVTTNTTTKLAFRTRNPDEARAVGEMLFAAEYNPRTIKYQGEPRIEVVPVAKEGMTEDVTTTSQFGGARASGGASTSSETQDPRADVVVTTNTFSTDEHDTDSYSYGESVSHRKERWVEYLYRVIEADPEFMTPEELRMEWCAKVMQQGVGEAMLNVGDGLPTLALNIIRKNSRSYPKLRPVRPERILEYKKEVYSRLHVLTAPDVQKLLEKRHAVVLEHLSKHKKELEQIGNDTVADSATVEQRQRVEWAPPPERGRTVRRKKRTPPSAKAEEG